MMNVGIFRRKKGDPGLMKWALEVWLPLWAVLSDRDSQGVWGMEEAPIKQTAKHLTPVACALFERSELHTIAKRLTPWLGVVAKRWECGYLT